MEFSSVISPLTGRPETRLIEIYKPQSIVDLYLSQINFSCEYVFENVSSVALYECLATGYKFFYPFTIEGSDSFYQDLVKSKSRYYHERWEHKEGLRHIKQNEAWLEVGSGGGEFLTLCSERSISILGLELNSEAIRLLREAGFSVLNGRIEEHQKDRTGNYDGVVLFQVLEHIADVGNMFRHLNRLLRVGGKLIIGVPNNDPYLFGFDKLHAFNLPPHHMGWWNRKSIIAAGELFGFEVLEFKLEPLSVEDLSYCLSHSAYKGIWKRFSMVIVRIIRKREGILSTLMLFILRFSSFRSRNLLVVFRKRI